jgi:tRNA-specific 2-thiouridylase
MARKRVLVAMSGGVDSSCTAALLLEQGHEVVGATFKLFDPPPLHHIDDAKKVAEILGIRHLVLDFSRSFSTNVIDYFLHEYISGRTPNPCVVCNKKIKFGKALDFAIENGFDHIATGHYVLSGFDERTERWLIRKSPTEKDQSYCLYTMSQMQISRMLFPLGKISKLQVRDIVKKIGLPVYNKPESQDICFIKGKHSDFIASSVRIPEFGDFIDENGKILGKHKGIFNYTVGQRRRLGTGFGERAYVQKINPTENTVTLSFEPPTSRSIVAEKTNFILFDRLDSEVELNAKIRYNCKEVPAVVKPIGENKITAEFKEDIKFIAPGQSIVFYDGDILVGGGVIT